MTQRVITRILKGDATGVQLLCANCHAIKTREAAAAPRPRWDEGLGKFMQALDTTGVPLV